MWDRNEADIKRNKVKLKKCPDCKSLMSEVFDALLRGGKYDYYWCRACGIKTDMLTGDLI